MNFECSVNELFDTYNRIAKFADTTTDAIFKLVKLTVDDNKLYMEMSTNVSNACVELPILSGTPGSICVDSTIFRKSIRKTNADFKVYKFSEDGMGGAVAIVEGSTGAITERTNAFQVKDSALFTNFGTTEQAECSMKIKASELKTALALTRCIMDQTITNEQYKYMIVEASTATNSIMFITTNGSQLSRTEIACEFTVANDHVFSLSYNDLATLFTLLSGCGADDHVVIEAFPSAIACTYPTLLTKFTTCRLNVARFNWRSVMAFTGSGSTSFMVGVGVLRDMLSGVFFDNKSGVQIIKLFVEDGVITSHSGNNIAGETISATTDTSVSGVAITLDAGKVIKAINGHKKDTSLMITESGSTRVMITPRLGENIEGLLHFSQVWATIPKG